MIELIISNFNFDKISWVLRKRIIFIVLATVLGGTLLGYGKYRSNRVIYRSQVSMYVYSDPSYRYETNINVSNSEFAAAKNLVKSYMMVLTSNNVLSKVINQLGLQTTEASLASRISSSAIADTSIFYIYVTSTDPYVSMEVANALADIAPDEIARVVKSGGIEVIDHATLPTAPFATANIPKYTIFGAGVGFALSLALSLLFGLLDSVIRKKSELLSWFDLPILGEVPIIYDPSKKVKANKILNDNAPFSLNEAYSMLRTNLQFSSRGEKCPVFGITSTDSGDGKTMNIINIAISFAKLGKKVLLIDCDLRNPSIHKHLNIEQNQMGLSQYLAGIEDKVNVHEFEVKDLAILTAGLIPPNPSDLIGSSRMERLIETMKEEFDYIFIDMSPIGTVSDPLQFVSLLTGYLIVVRNNVSKINDLKSIVAELERINANISGFIYNAVDDKQLRYSAKKANYIYETKQGSDKKVS